MLNGGNDDRVEVVISETATFRGIPCNSFLLGFDQKEYKFFFLRPQEPGRIDIHIFHMLLGKLFRGDEAGRLFWQNRKREKWIRGNAVENMGFLR